MLIVPAYFLAGDERTARLMTAFDWRAPPVPVNYRIDAWVTPPSYTGRPPVILPTRRSGEAPQPGAETETFRVPARLDRDAACRRSLRDRREAGGRRCRSPGAGAPVGHGNSASGPLAETRWTVAQDGTLSVQGKGAAPLSWRFEAIADRAPTIAFEREPQTDRRNQFVLSYKVEDDYGVKEAEATLSLAPSALALQREGARPLAELPPVPLTMPQARTRSGSGQTSRDFAEHPFAGLQVAVEASCRG